MKSNKDTKKKRGHPTLYDDKYIVSVEEYLKSCRDVITKELVGLSKKGTELYKDKLIVNLPTIEGFAVYIGVHKDTIYEWRKTHKEFSDSLGKILAEQQKRLLNNGLSGDYNSTIAKLVLSSNHGMSEKVNSDITTNGESIQPLLVKFLDDGKRKKNNGNTK